MANDWGYDPNESEEWKKINKSVRRAKRQTNRIRKRRERKAEKGGGCSLFLIGMFTTIMTALVLAFKRSS
jgi:hypothetical protein